MTIKTGQIQYAYALDDQGVIIHISDAQRANDYTCPGCTKALSAVLGEKNTWHFRHHNDCCALETYLHHCAKEAFFQHYVKAIENSFPIELMLERSVFCEGPRIALTGERGVVCQKKMPARYNLLKIFDSAELEKTDRRTGMRPDIMLSHSLSSRKCYVEICVTHPCTQEKLDSGVPILEFKIRSALDIEILLGNKHSAADERLSAHNWYPPPYTESDCIGDCSVGHVEMSVWSLSSSGRISEKSVRLADVDLTSSSPANTWPTSLSSAETHKRQRAFLRHADPRSRFPNCILCKEASQWGAGYLNCKFKAKRVPYTEARQCAVYEEADT